MTSSADLSKWSFATPVGSYQYYIHGSGPVTDYVNLDTSFKNPADKASKQGAKITIDETAKWNGQTMLRTSSSRDVCTALAGRRASRLLVEGSFVWRVRCVAARGDAVVERVVDGPEECFQVMVRLVGLREGHPPFHAGGFGVNCRAPCRWVVSGCRR